MKTLPGGYDMEFNEEAINIPGTETATDDRKSNLSRSKDFDP